MTKRNSIKFAVALAACALVSMHGAALAQNSNKQKVTYEQAWKLCKEALNKETHSNLDTNTRYLRGGACMAKFGYKF